MDKQAVPESGTETFPEAPDVESLATSDTVAPPDGDYAHRSPTMRPVLPPPALVDTTGEKVDAPF